MNALRSIRDGTAALGMGAKPTPKIETKLGEITSIENPSPRRTRAMKPSPKRTPPMAETVSAHTRRLTGERRCRQACKLAQMRANRRFRDFMAGRLPYLECSNPEPEIIRELDRAYAAGIADARAALNRAERG